MPTIVATISTRAKIVTRVRALIKLTGQGTPAFGDLTSLTKRRGQRTGLNLHLQVWRKDIIVHIGRELIYSLEIWVAVSALLS